MPACANGARPKPGITSGTVVLQVTQMVMGDIAALLGGIWGELAIQPVLMRMSIANLCELNLSDPGPPTANDLAAVANFFTPFAGQLPSTGVPAWLLKQVQYHYFRESCECIQPGETIPPRGLVPYPSGEPPYPTDPDSQPQPTRIERHSRYGSDALDTLYRGILANHADLGDLAMRLRPNYPTHIGPLVAEASGEGVADLPGVYVPSQQTVMPDCAGVRVYIRQLPTVYKQRGTLHPRYYGVGSLMWIGEEAGGNDMVTRRESIHYRSQFFPLPSQAVAWRIAWRIMPGGIVTITQVPRTVDGAYYGNQGYSDEGFDPLSALAPPDDFVDPPFSPASTRRMYSLPPAAPP